MILIEVDSSFLDEAINATAFETDTTIAFIKDQQLLYKNSEEFSDDTMVKIEKDYQDLSTSSNFYREKAFENKYFITREFNSSLSLSIISLISYSELMRGTTLLHMFILLLIFLFSIIIFFTAYSFSNKLMGQVSMIRDIFSNNLAAGQPARPQPFGNDKIERQPAKPQPFGDDEIGQIGKECETLLS